MILLVKTPPEMLNWLDLRKKALPVDLEQGEIMAVTASAERELITRAPLIELGRIELKCRVRIVVHTMVKVGSKDRKKELHCMPDVSCDHTALSCGHGCSPADNSVMLYLPKASHAET